MRIQLQTLGFEGTPEEFASKSVADFMALVGGKASTALVPEPQPVDQTSQSSPVSTELTPEVAEAALTRIPLSQSQKGVLQAVRAAGDTGIISSEIAKATGLTRREISGVLGALGRRMSHTKGWPKGAKLFKDKWDGPAGQWRYWLSDPIREVLEGGQVTL